MPADGGTGLGAQQQENAREGIIARASEKLQKFREVIQTLFTKEGSDKINKKDKPRIDQILAIAEDDVARVKKEGAPLEMILEEAKAGLAGVTLKEDLNSAVEGLKKKQKDEIEDALKKYREALVGVLKEGEETEVKREEKMSTSTKAEVAPQEAGGVVGEGSEDHDGKEKRPPRSKKTGNVREGWMDDIDAHFTRDFREDEDLLSAVLEYRKPSNHIKEYEALIDLASQAYKALSKLRAYEDRAVDEERNLENFKAYEESIKAVESAAAAYVALAGETPASIDSNASTPEPVESALSDEALIEAVLDAPNPKRDDLVGPFQRMMLLATRADALSRRVKTDEGQREEYVQKLGELRTAREMYQALERAEPPVGGQVQAEEEGEAEPVIPRGAPVADIADLAGMLRRSSNSKKAPQRPDASLSEGTDNGSVNVPADVAERLKIETEARAEARAEKESKDVIRLVEGLRADRKRETMALAALFKGSNENQAAFEALMEEDLRVHVARWLVDFMDGQYEMVRLPANEAWKEVTDAKGNVMQVMEANEADKDEYRKTAVAESTYALAAVVKAGANFGFTDENEIRALALEPLPSEQKGGLGSFVMDAGKALGKERQRGELQAAAREISSINEKLSKHALKLVMLGEDEVHTLEARRDELLATRKQLMEDLTGNSFKDKVAPTTAPGERAESRTPLQESLQDNEDRLKLFKGAIANWKDTTPIDGVIGGWVTWLEAVIEAQKALEKATAPEERTARIENVEAAIVIRPAESEVKRIQEWIKTQRSEGKQEYIISIVEPRADAFALVRGFKAQKLTELLQTEKQASVSKVDGSDDPVVEMIDDEGDAPSVAPGSPDATPPASPEAAKVNVEQADLKTQTEAARARLEEIKAIIGSWDTKENLVHDDKLIKEAVKRFEEIVAHDEAFLANGDKDGSYEGARKKLTRGGHLGRLQERIFEVVSKNKPIYAEQFSAWIKKEEGKPEKERNNAWIEQLQKRQAAVQALKPLFEAFLASASQPTPDAKPAPTPDAPPAPDAAPAPDASAAPTSADAVPPTPDVKTSAPTPDAAAPVPPAAPPSAPDVIPPAPPTPDKANARPEPGFANEALFSAVDRATILTWLKAQQLRVDRAQKLRVDKDLDEARKRYEPFGLNLARLESIVNATARLTEAKTDKERMDREAILMNLREGGVILGAEAALSEIKAERRQLKGDAQHFEDNTPYSGQFQRSKSEIKARIKQIDAEMELMEMNVELEQALMETVIVKTTKEDPGKFKNEIAEGEARVEQKDTSWKEVADTASQAHDELRARMETRKRDTEAEPYFGGIFQAILKEQEAAIGLGKALRRFDILDKTELQITQALRLLDNAPSGPITPEQWNALPSAARSVLKRSGENESSTGENIKGRLYEILRSLTNDKSKANKDLQDQLGLVNGMKEQSSYVLAQKTYQKLQADQKQVAQEVRRLTGDIETYNPLKVTKMADKNVYVEKLKEVNGRLELAKNQQRHIEALLKGGEALLGISGRTLWGQYQKKGGEAIDQAGAFEALKNQQEVTKLVVQVIDGQDRLARLRLTEATREEEIRKTLPVLSAKGGGASFGKGTPAPKNPTSGGGGEKEKSVWESFKETGLYKGAAQFVDALTFWK